MDVSHQQHALRNIYIADHVLTVTYPIVEDPKLLKLAFHKIITSVHQTLLLLWKEHNSQSVSLAELQPYLPHLFEQYQLSPQYLNFINTLIHLHATQQQADVEFVRKGTMVFADENYTLEQLKLETIKEFMVTTTMLYQQITGALS